MISRQELLERSYRRQIRNLEMEVSFLRDVTWTLTDGKHEIFDIPIQTTRKEEEVGPAPVDETCRMILQDMLN